MDRALIAALGASCVVSATASAAAQSRCDARRPSAVLADLGLHVVGVGFQRALGCHVVAQTSLNLYSPWTVNNNVLGLGGEDHNPAGDVLGLVVRGRVFVHPFGDAPQGFWISPYAQAGHVWATRAGVALDGTTFAVGLSVGWTFRLGDRWLLGLGLGAQYHLAMFGDSSAFPGYSRFAPTLDINLGFAL